MVFAVRTIFSRTKGLKGKKFISYQFSKLVDIVGCLVL